MYVKWRGNAKRNLREGMCERRMKSVRIEWRERRGEWKGEKKSEMVRGGDGKTLTSSSTSFV